MASILGIELDVGTGDVADLHVSVASQTVADGRRLASVFVYNKEPWELLLSVQEYGQNESEAIAALEAKVRRLPGVLAVLNSEGK